MNKVTKKIFAMVLSLVMAFSLTVILAEAAEVQCDAKKDMVTMTVERFTIGQGFLVEPAQVEISDGDTVADVFAKVMADKGITYPSTESQYGGFYLNSINNADTGVLGIPAEISAMPDVALWDGSMVKAPANNVNDGNAYANNGLGTGSYNIMAGWLFTVNNKNVGEGADVVKVKSGDVIRWQFSVYGYGADIGFDTESYTDIPKITLSDKDELIKEAGIAAYNKEMLKNAGVKSAYNNAICVLEKYNPAQSEVNDALLQLQKAERTYADNLNPETNVKENPKAGAKVQVARAAIKSVRNVKKYRVKISLKKLKGVLGYQYKYAANRKFKRAAVKSTRKSVLITKKFKKKQTCYVKVRAYKKVNGVKRYGKWSRIKSVKIKK